MELIIKIIDKRLYNDFMNWAKANNMSDDDIEKYVFKAFKERFMLDKFGDLNDKIEPPKQAKNKQKQKENVEVSIEPIIIKQEPTVEKEEVVETIITTEEVDTVKPRRKKVIKSK
jgi:hypothetical protein